MKFKITVLVVVFLQLSFSVCILAHTQTSKYIKFVENKNQWDKQVKYKAKFNFGEVYLEQNSFLYCFYDVDLGHIMHHNSEFSTREGKDYNLHFIKTKFVGANQNSKIVSENKFDGYLNFFAGSDSSKWASNVNAYSDVFYNQIYNGVNLHYYSNGEKLKYDYIIEPHANTKLIKLQYEGANKLQIIENELIISTSVGQIKETKPYAFQIINGKKTVVKCEYILNNDVVSFHFPNGYNKNYQLIIDPELIFASFTGSTADNWGFTATYDNLGNAYAGGIVFATALTSYVITPGAYQVTFGGGVATPGIGLGFDMAISKYNADGSDFLYSTYLGGNNNEQPHSLVVNNNNELYIFGRTTSSNYPVTATAYDVSYNNLSDIVISKLSVDGSDLLASTFVGGSEDDGVNFSSIEFVKGELKYNYADDARGEIIVDANDNVYIAACTNSSDFPVSSGCFQAAKGSDQDGCIFKLNSDLSLLVFSSYLGGNGRDAAYAITRLSNNDIVVVGGTQSSNLVTTSSVLHSFFSGGRADGFIYKINANASSVVSASYLGTNEYDQVYFVQTDNDDDVYVYGQTEGIYPVTEGKYNNPNSGQFIHKMNNTFTETIYSTVFGTGQGKPDISPTAFLVDRCENVYCAGWGGQLFGYNNPWSTTIGLPVTPTGIQTTTNSDDLYFFILRKNAGSLEHATFFGGINSKEHVDGGTCRFDKNGIIYQAVCAGCGGFSDMIAPNSNVVSDVNRSSNCNYAMIKYKFDLTETTANFGFIADTLGCAPFHVDFENTSTGYESLIWDFDDGTTSQDISPSHVFYSPGVYNVRLITFNPNTCNEKDTAIKKIHVNFPFAITALGNKTMCFGDSIQLNATYVNAISYRWSPSALVSPIDTIPIVKVSPSTTSTFSVVINDGDCKVTDVTTITVNQNNTQITPRNNLEFCADSYIALDAGNNYISYQWSDGTNNQKLTTTISGKYNVVTIDSNNCVGKDSVTVTKLNPIDLDVFPDTIICQNQSVKLQAIGADSYFWKPNLFLNDTVGSKVICRPNLSIDYYIKGIIKNCVAFDSLHVEVLPNPSIDLGNDFFVRKGEEVSLSVKTDSLLYWYPSEKLSCDSCLTPVFISDSTRTFFAKTANSLGCISIDSVTVYVDDASSVYLPNCFTPNSDFTNDTYKVIYYGLLNYSMGIYDRWGNLVYSWTENEKGWDGTYDGKACKTRRICVFIYSKRF